MLFAPRGQRSAPAAAPPQGAWESTKAGIRGVQDSLPFNLGDHAPAVIYALGDALRSGQFLAAYNQRLEAERGQNRYDEAVHPTARTIGKVAGTAVQMAALPVEGLLVKGGARVAGATPLMWRELAALGGAGGLAGVSGRGVSNLARGERSSFADYAGDFVGGATDALVSRYGNGGIAGAAGGSAGSLAQDILNGRRPSLERMRVAAEDGAALALPLGMAGRSLSNRLSISKKGKLGERLSVVRTLARGELPRRGPRKAAYPEEGVTRAGSKKKGWDRGPATIVDQRTRAGTYVESKFGLNNDLSENQMLARWVYGPKKYRTDSFLPRDIGALTAMPGYQVGIQFDRDED